jgi:Zn finger protein HypA/HybF involved in hydrogenase expression
MRKTIRYSDRRKRVMVVHNASIDPHRSEHGYYECQSCGGRTTSDRRLETCPTCGGDVRNIAVARE